MKPDQRSIYARRIDRVLAHIAVRLNEGVVPDLEELAAVASLSEYHFHRVFRLMTGETLASMVRRVRIAMSLPVLATESGSVTEATAAAAYATTQAYARALKAGSGASPTGARRNPGELTGLIEQLRHPPCRPSDDALPAPALQVEIVAFEPLQIIALRNVGEYAELDRAYTRLFDLLPDPTAVTGLYGIPYDDPLQTAPSDCRFDCCVTFAAVPATALSAALRELQIGGGQCARLYQTGSYDLVWRNLDVLYRHVLDELDQTLSDSPPFVHYFDDPELVRTENLRAELYLPLTVETPV